jgi:hypothetical protein
MPFNPPATFSMNCYDAMCEVLLGSLENGTHSDDTPKE